MARWEEVMLQNIEKASNDYVNIKDLSYGIVESLNPLVINDEGLLLYKEDILINEDLLPHNEIYSSFKADINGETKTYSNVSIKTTSKIKKGDMVALKEVNDSLKIVLCKVVQGRDII